MFDAKAQLKLPLTKLVIFDCETLTLDARWNPELAVYCVCLLEVAEDGSKTLRKFYDVTKAIARLDLLLNAGWLAIAHNARFDYSVLKIRGLQHKIIPGVLSIGCSMIMEYNRDSTKDSYSLQALTGKKTDVIGAFVDAGLLEEKITDVDFWNRDWSTNDAALKLIANYCSADVKATLGLYNRQARWYNSEPKFINTLAFIEFPMLECLSELEVSGAHIDSKLLSQITYDLTQKRVEIERQITNEAGLLPKLQWSGESYAAFAKTYSGGATEYWATHDDNNIGDLEWEGYKNKRNLLSHYVDNEGIVMTQWVGHMPATDDGSYVFDYCPLLPYNSAAATGHTWWLLKRYCPDVLKKAEATKKGKPQLNKDFLKDVGDDIPSDLPLSKLAKVNKLLSMVEGISRYVQHDGRIHPSFNNTQTRTGRLSCSSPNFQQMPRVGTEVDGVDYGLKIRALFAAPEKHKILIADLDRIEISVLAFFLQAMCKDGSLRDVVNTEGSDVHQANADKWGVSRTVAKTLVFLLVYGGQPPLMFKRGLAKSLEEAEAMFASVNEGQPSIAKAKQMVYKRIVQRGYISNPFNARGLYPELSGTKWQRLRGERQSFNYLIQRTARDIMHLLTIHSLPIVKRYGGKLINLVHDELAVECPAEVADVLKQELNTIWQKRLDILPGTRVNGDWNIGNNWAEAK